jgi:peptidoglycan/xylan/chitin deacetylase (PgdA/CDA1 family)
LVDSLPILTFHALDDEPAAISFSPRLFRRSMARLHDSGYRCLGLMEAVDCFQQGRPFPPRSFVITFDDGYRSVYEQAFSVLQRHGLSATIFLTVGEGTTATSTARLPSLSGRPMLAWREIREMQRWGIEFGAHTLTHPDLTRLPPARTAAEVQESKAVIEDVLGVRVDAFAYPFGRHDRRSRDFVRQHFACACSDKLGLVTAGSDPHALERVDAYYLRTERLFSVMLTRWFPCYIQARGIPRRIRRRIHLRSGAGD